MAHITIYAKVRGTTPSNPSGEGRRLENTYLDVVMLPTAPIAIGSHVRVCTLEARPRTIARPRPGSNVPKYMATVANIHGKIVGVKGFEEFVTELVLENEDGWSRTQFAYLAIPHVEGVTVSLTPAWQTIRATLVPFMPKTRRILIEPITDIEWTAQEEHLPTYDESTE
ncbi:hypothetical protein GY45DRAFT_1240832 [Cubamyces sp. BRFM 1775]|nr:hypothetical protein GY45DRAFT_1240832 [Cubamyces sp. BRFM 1775]